MRLTCYQCFYYAYMRWSWHGHLTWKDVWVQVWTTPISCKPLKIKPIILPWRWRQCMYIFMLRYLHLHREHFHWNDLTRICCDCFESNLWDGYPLKCDSLFNFDCCIRAIKWSVKLDNLGWRGRGLNSRPFAAQANVSPIRLIRGCLMRALYKKCI